MRATRTIRAALLLVLAVAFATRAQGQRAAQSIASMGQPPIWHPYVVGGASFGGPLDRTDGLVSFGVLRHVTNPVTGLLAAKAEGYASVASSLQPGVRLLAASPAFGLAAGADWNVDDGDVATILSFQTAIRRGGLLGRGTMLRFDWIPRRNNQIAFGIHLPLGDALAGRTRAQETDHDFASDVTFRVRSVPIPRRAEAALIRVNYAAAQILAYTNLFAEDTTITRYGRSFTHATQSYREELAVAFAAVTGDSALGARIADHARANLLDAVLLPYDRLFGQSKDVGIWPLIANAQQRFSAWVRDSGVVAAAYVPAVEHVHARWLSVIEAVQSNLLDQWGDTRLVWLPLQLALTEDQYDEQTEVDGLIERAVGRPFTDNNALTYLRSSDLPLEIARSIFATRDYHVLWTHDFTGRRDITKEVDDIAYTMVADAYLPALTQAVARYDSTGQMPVYMILLDQFYYESRDGRLWMSILENPLHASMRLPGNNGAREAHLRERQDALRRAVAASRRLQREAADSGGASWLSRVVKVHVNVVLPSDFSFRSSHIIPGIPFLPDNLQRDHRKLVLYDLTESDPYRGAAIITGVGIGEHYASATWEDRGYRVRGPAAIEAKAAARRALLENGIPENRLPPPLREAKAASAPADARTYVGRALQVHNEPGFRAKESSVARAMLYNLAPPGSVIIVPDPLWVSDTWAAMLAGAAARGCRVYIISPSLANGPNPQPPVAAIQHDVMQRLLDINRRIGPQIHAAGGELRVGLYTARAEVTDLEGRRREITEGLERSPWIKQLIPFDSATLAVLNQATTRTEADGEVGTSLAHDERPRAPQLHQKTQLIARPGAIAALTRQSGWDRVFAQAMQAQSRQSTDFAKELGYVAPEIDSAATRSADGMIRGYEQSLSPAERKSVSFYFTLGSQNEDPRGIMQDGEASLVVSGVHAALGLVDLYYIMARSTWITTPEELDRLLPRPKGIQGRLARLMRAVL
ncbi:MAG TPA: hypothetical protein VJ867_17145 [Gemmatimonadaceae bacterium]|nr:hypothetical protein [Gemmatimonadaceae bacterium]